MNNSTQTKSTTKVGFIGLGDQGGPMAQAVSQVGFSLHVWARRNIFLEILSGYEYTSHQSPQELGSACDIILLCLTDDADIWDLINNKNLLASLKKGATVVNHGTGDPGDNILIGNYLQGKGFRFLDAPVSGGRSGAIARTLTTSVGDMSVETATHLQGLMRKDILHFVDAYKHLDAPTQTIYQWADSGVERLVNTIQVLSNE